VTAPAKARAESRWIAFIGASGNRLMGNVFRAEAYGKSAEAARPVLLLHGGGQTRYAWRTTAAPSPTLGGRPMRSTSVVMAIPNGSRTAPMGSTIGARPRGSCEGIPLPRTQCAFRRRLGGTAHGGGRSQRPVRGTILGFVSTLDLQTNPMDGVPI